MAVLDNELLEDAALDAEIVAHVQRTLPAEVAARFDEEQLYYFHDLIEEFLAESDILEAEPDEEGFVNVDLERIADTLRRTALKDKVAISRSKTLNSSSRPNCLTAMTLSDAFGLVPHHTTTSLADLRDR